MRNEIENFKKRIVEIEDEYNVNVIYSFVRGSHLYGLNTEKSDVDISFVYVQNTEDILKGRYRPKIELDNNNIEGYEVARYLELLKENKPSALEGLAAPDDCVITRRYDAILFATPETWLTCTAKDSFLGYANSQIKKARGLNKKMNNKVEKKTIIDFCFIIENGRSVSLYDYYGEDLPKIIKNAGLVRIPNGRGLYGLYVGNDATRFRGLVKDENSGQLRLSSIPKDYTEVRVASTLYFAMDAYQSHNKSYGEYVKWLKNRNEERYKLNQVAGQNVDLKNMSHLFRILEVAENISLGKGVIVRTEQRDFLTSIKEGKYSYERLVEMYEEIKERIINNFNKLSLPESIEQSFCENILFRFRTLY